MKELGTTYELYMGSWFLYHTNLDFHFHTAYRAHVSHVYA